MNPDDPRKQPGMARRQGTVIESVEEIRAQIRGASVQKATVDATAAAAEPEQDAKPFRPLLRPSMASLCVIDDGEDSGEIVRLRANSFVIGRADGDLLIPHDSGISGRHAEISRRSEHEERAWYLKDLQSTNGTFVRVATVIMVHDQEILIGSHRFRVEMITTATEPMPSPETNINATRKFESLSVSRVVATAPPKLVDISRGPDGRRFSLTEPEHWLGRDPRACSIVIDDPMVDRRHARVFRDDKNRWTMANNRSRNGIWVRIQEVGLGRGAFFQCGEQRFLFKVF